MDAHVVRSGTVIIKEDGFATSWLWRPKWLVLKERTLSIHKNEVRLLYHPHITIRPVTTQPHFCSLDQLPVWNYQPPGYYRRGTDCPQALLPSCRDEG